MPLTAFSRSVTAGQSLSNDLSNGTFSPWPSNHRLRSFVPRLTTVTVLWGTATSRGTATNGDGGWPGGGGGGAAAFGRGGGVAARRGGCSGGVAAGGGALGGGGGAFGGGVADRGLAFGIGLGVAPTFWALALGVGLGVAPTA